VLEWLAAAQAADDRDEEINAREALIPHLEGEARVAVAASTAIARLLHVPGAQPLLRAKSATAALLNLELALPGSDPSKRAVALRGVGVALGADAQAQAARMAAWSDLAGGAFGDAQKAFKALSDDDPEDLVAWEGLRAASAQLGDHTTRGIALARLGNLCQDDERSAELWEQAGLVLLDYTEAHADAEIAFQRALERDVTRGVAFDKLFRRVRARKDNDRLLQLIDLRLKVTDDTSEIIKMYWERARVYRDKGDNDRALSCLKDVTILEPDHVGALALAGEIAIKKGDFAEAAPFLAKLATLDGAPKKQRLLSGIAAVDLYEKKLGQPDKSLGVLSQLYRDGLSTLKVRERLARTAAKVGNWDEAVRILERLMEERDQSAGRAEAARLAMAIYRDKLRQPSRAAKAVGRLLSEVPDDRESLELLLTADVSDALKSSAVPKAKQLILQSLADAPFDRPRVELLANIAALQKEPNLRRAALGVALALGNEDSDAKVAIAELDARAVKEPQIVLNATSVQAIADPDDIGPIPLMLAIAAPAVSEAMGPNLKSEDLGRKNRVDSAHPVRAEVARWMGALGFGEFQVYVGGREPTAVKGVSEDEPVLVVGSGIATPLDIASRLAVAREVFALRRGTTCVMYNDDNTVASIVVAICQDAGVQVADPPYAVFREIQRRIKKAMSRKIRNQIRELCQQIVQSGQDAHDWAGAARRSIDRMALIAAGDAGGVLDAAIGPPGSAARLAMSKDVRAKSLLSFALSSEYLELRQKLGMGVA
jgi:tetratricopeptide (TPR) repeat protein